MTYGNPRTLYPKLHPPEYYSTSLLISAQDDFLRAILPSIPHFRIPIHENALVHFLQSVCHRASGKRRRLNVCRHRGNFASSHILYSSLPPEVRRPAVDRRIPTFQ